MTDKARILFVDDEKRVLNSMRGLFRRDYELFLTSEGAEAIKIAAENEIDVIVADQRMPGMTGIEVLTRMKKQSPRTIRILLTGYADPSAVEGSINLGEVFRFLSKPCPPNVLRETLSLAIAAARTKPVEIPASQPAQTATPQPAAVRRPQPEQTSVRTQTPAPPQRPTQPPAVTPPAPRISAAVHEASMPKALNDDDATQPALQILDESAMAHHDEQTGGHWQSVTNVVMSEDSVEETQENVALTSANLALQDVGIVIFTVDSEFATTAIRAASNDRNTFLATTLVKVAEAIHKQNAGVLVTDFTTNNTTLQKIIGALKKHMPELVTIVVTNGRDTTDMINLVNYGQIFRYVLKPIAPEALRTEINAAVMHHLYLMNNPDSAKRHQVLEAQEPEGSSKTVDQFIGKVRQL